VQKRPLRADKLKSILVDRLERGRLQPRRSIDGIALRKLAESIRSEGVVQPLFVRKVARGKFEIVAGERRWRAAKMAGLKRVPTIIRNVSDETALAIALIENLHREDLNPIDQAYAVQQLVETFSMTHQEVADTVGRSRATITNLLRLLELPADVRTMLADGKLDVGHARALLTLPEDRRAAAAEQVVAGRMSVRDVEHMVKHSTTGPSGAHARRQDAEPAPFQSWIGERVGNGINVKPKKGSGWCLSIAFEDLDELRCTLKILDDLLQGLEEPQPSAQQRSR
jgi:ParB family chromosome partitioning protein